jgi:hypothetical protein
MKATSYTERDGTYQKYLGQIPGITAGVGTNTPHRAGDQDNVKDTHGGAKGGRMPRVNLSIEKGNRSHYAIESDRRPTKPASEVQLDYDMNPCVN